MHTYRYYIYPKYSTIPVLVAASGQRTIVGADCGQGRSLRDIPGTGRDLGPSDIGRSSGGNPATTLEDTTHRPTKTAPSTHPLHVGYYDIDCRCPLSAVCRVRSKQSQQRTPRRRRRCCCCSLVWIRPDRPALLRVSRASRALEGRADKNSSPQMARSGERPAACKKIVARVC